MNKIGEILRRGKIVALTGAGVSEESGVPTFRGDSGIWKRYNPAIFANSPGLITTYLTRPHRVSEFVVDIYSTIIDARPNPGHFALRKLEEAGLLMAVITQNIDNLHQEAGSRSVIELHGNIFKYRCMRCRRREKIEKEEIIKVIDYIKEHRGSRLALKRLLRRCKCGGIERPDVVLFGESLPEEEVRKARLELDDCKLLLLIGTSGVVYPAAYLPYYAKEHGAKIIEIGPKKTSLSWLSDFFIQGRAGERLPEIMEWIGL
jgi:NAD-dependent deacetylase